ncbi:hypothetical protein ASPCAL03821 [Aspergillus calidoustus]|uniref:Uncharacterized protein n=1 Tax=Aspergillus calidoustus TaxID=454130 RepID=A0A0U5FZV1_ASPCI|nr:hypothetical protein ASPCAL03821 [Aspergillus calidoustus]
MDSTQPQPQTGFRSRRSYPSLNQISVAPLTPRYPIDDDDGDSNESQQDYFTPRNESVETPTRTSYLSSYSVPGTPGVLSRTPSRSGSRVRHHTRSKSSTPIHLSDSSLHDQNVNPPLHHHRHHSRSSGSRKTKRPTAVRHQTADARDPEWMLRAGIALASSAREEKGQSWLVKRESSTSLVSEGQKYEVDAISQSLRTSMGRRSRSGRSTPAAFSRSRTESRRNSRPDLSMTGLEMTMPSSSTRSSIHAGSRPRTPHTNDEPRSSLSLLPDFIDERVRAEMRDTMEQGDGGYDSAASNDWDSSSSEDEEMDERELRRLTRERGFGLGSFVDRLVEWTLFGVDDWPLSSADPLNNGPPGPEEAHPEEPHQIATRSIAESSDNDHDETRSQASDTTHEELPAEMAGEHGGWEDAGWFFRAMRRALISA